MRFAGGPLSRSAHNAITPTSRRNQTTSASRSALVALVGFSGSMKLSRHQRLRGRTHVISSLNVTHAATVLRFTDTVHVGFVSGASSDASSRPYTDRDGGYSNITDVISS